MVAFTPLHIVACIDASRNAQWATKHSEFWGFASSKVFISYLVDLYLDGRGSQSYVILDPRSCRCFVRGLAAACETIVRRPPFPAGSGEVANSNGQPAVLEYSQLPSQ